jgi:hypothetical protein
VFATVKCAEKIKYFYNIQPFTSRSTQRCKMALQQQRAQRVLYFYKLMFVTEFQRLGNNIHSCKSDVL